MYIQKISWSKWTKKRWFRVCKGWTTTQVSGDHFFSTIYKDPGIKPTRISWKISEGPFSWLIWSFKSLPQIWPTRSWPMLSDVFKTILKIQVYIYINTYLSLEPNGLVFVQLNLPKQGLNSNQNKGHLGSKYIHTPPNTWHINKRPKYAIQADPLPWMQPLKSVYFCWR